MLADCLRAHGDRTAIYTDTEQLSYRALADRVAETTPALGPGRRLVLLETHNDTDTLVHYLGALAAGHVVIPVSPGRDHTTIMHGVRKIEELCAEDHGMAEDVQLLRRALEA